MAVLSAPLHPMLDKEEDARKESPGNFKRFVAWIEEQGWKWCYVTLDHPRSCPEKLPLTIARSIGLGPTDEAGSGSNALGEWIEECRENGIDILRYHEGTGTDGIVEMLESERRSSKEATQDFYDFFNFPTLHPAYDAAGRRKQIEMRDKLLEMFPLEEDES